MNNEKQLPISIDAGQGLSNAQVKDRIARGLSNVAVEPPSKSVGDIIRDNVYTYFNLIFAIIAVLLILVGSFRSLTFLPVIIFNTLIGIIQEIRAKRVLDNLKMLNVPQVQVVRGGKVIRIPAEDAVQDDIVVLEAGNQICADAVVVKGEVFVNEALLTGEPDEIKKCVGDQLMSGSFVVSGACRARLVRVGAESYISRLTLEAKTIKTEEQSEMIRSLNKLVKTVGILIIPLGVVLFLQQFVFSDVSLRDSVEGTMAAIIGMIPEGLYLLASVAMVVSSMRLASRHVLLHDMRCIETLARVDVLCVDKTGTITENEMQVVGMESAGGYDSTTMAPLDQLVGEFAAVMSNDNITMRAIKAYMGAEKGRKRKKAKEVLPFSSVYKYSAVCFEDGNYVLGAPEAILREQYVFYEEQLATYYESGQRVLAFARYSGKPEGKPLTEQITLLGFVLLANPVRPDAPATFDFFESQGVTVKVISGDNPVAVSKIAMQAGIVGAEDYVDAATLKTEEDIEDAALDYTVFGRVTPAQKKKLIEALKRAGKTVAMTGDGVNDVLALKAADCSVAMASGSDAAAQASQLVLLDSNFACMTDVVMEGRRVVNNIERSASLFLVKNMFSFLLAIASLCFAFSYPFEPSQVSLISMFTIGIPAFLLAMEPNKKKITGKFLTNVMLKALPAGLTDALIVGFLVVVGKTFEVPAADISTAATMLLALVGFMILYRISRPMNGLRWAIWGLCLAGLILCAIYLRDLFGLSGMSSKCVMLFVVFSIATEPMLRYLSKFIQLLEKRKVKRRMRKGKV